MKLTFEDFVPQDENTALITSGARITELTAIERVTYRVDSIGRVDLVDRLGVLAQGKHLRLGGFCDGRLVYSDEFRVVGAKAPGDGAHQPFLYEGACYYTDEWPYMRIWKDGVRYLDHFGGMVQVSNPHWYDGVMYFEARDTVAPDAPHAWRVCRLIPGQEPEVLFPGANPAAMGGHLFYGLWEGRGFQYYRLPIAGI